MISIPVFPIKPAFRVDDNHFLNPPFYLYSLSAVFPFTLRLIFYARIDSVIPLATSGSQGAAGSGRGTPDACR
jgi:hypothetical protein